MSVRRRRWVTPKTGEARECLMIDIRHRHPTGKIERIREVLDVRSEQAAWARHAKIIEELKAGVYWQNKEVRLKQHYKENRELTLEEFSEEFLTNYCAVNNRPATVDDRRRILERDILPVLGKRKISSIRFRDIEHLKAKLFVGANGRQRSKKTVRNLLGVLSRLMRYAEETEVIVQAPRFRLPKAEKAKFDFLDFEEADRLIEAASFNPEWRAMIFFAIRTGTRYGELCELRWGDVDLVKGQVIIARSYHRGNIGAPKSGRDRVIPLSPETVRMLEQQRRRQRRKGEVVELSTKNAMSSEEHEVLRSDLVFSKTDGGRHIHRRADVALKRCCRKAGLREIGWHVLRHSFASHLVMRGVPLKSVQELMGHATIEMTMRYSHLSPEVNRDAVALLDEKYLGLGHKRGTSAAISGAETKKALEFPGL